MSEDKQPDLVVAVETLKSAVSEAVDAALLDFERATGLTPSGIDLGMVEQARYGDRIKRYVLGSVTVGLGEW